VARAAVQRNAATNSTRFSTARITVGAPASGLRGGADSALVEGDSRGERRVAVVDTARRIVWTTVALRDTAAGWRELVGGGLTAGTRVVIEGQAGLPAGTRVQWNP
jgi:hypothetical protein